MRHNADNVDNFFRLCRKDDGKCLLKRVRVARSLMTRLAGLIPEKSLNPDEGMYFPNCGSIHTFFMHFAIDVIFLDKNITVQKICSSVPPWKAKMCHKGKAVLETSAGWAEAVNLKVGDTLILK